MASSARLWAKRVAVITAVLVLGLAVWHAYATRRTNAEYSMPGRLVDVGSHRLHCRCVGSGSMTIVIDAGLSGASYDWAHIQDALCTDAVVCTYDRAGYGWSDRASGPRTSQAIVADLHAMLRSVRVQPPYVLVGHSFGGINTRLYASTYPKDVAALVLIDALNTDVFPDDARCGHVGPLFKALRYTSWIGTPRFAMPFLIDAPDSELLRMRSKMLARSKTVHTVYSELASQTNWRTVRNSMKHLGHTPVLVISRGKYPSEPNHYEANWRKGQDALATAVSHNSRHVVAKNCGHDIQFEDPDLIVREIRSLLETVSDRQATGNVQSPVEGN